MKIDKSAVTLIMSLYELIKIQMQGKMDSPLKAGVYE